MLLLCHFSSAKIRQDKRGGYIEFLSKIQSGIDSILHPAFCALCGEYHESPSYWICSSCWTKICSETETPEPQFISNADDVIPAFAGWYFHSEIQHLIHCIKYNKHHTVGKIVGQQLALRIASRIDLSSIDYLVPVPLHKKREKERGFNQSHFISVGLKKAHRKLKILPALRRIKYTEAQVSLNSEQRRQNVAGAFTLNQRSLSCLQGASVAIVDDVMTTGSTALACAALLHQTKVKNIVIITIACA
ncbi:MAG: ComF family protein [Calditrichaeota bacterium]|nr:MAG: ComF family protein [Calditrichota bacterium]